MNLYIYIYIYIYDAVYVLGGHAEPRASWGVLIGCITHAMMQPRPGWLRAPHCHRARHCGCIVMNGWQGFFCP